MCRLQAQRRADTPARRPARRRRTDVRVGGDDARLPGRRRARQLCEPPHADAGTPGVGAGVRRLADVGEQPRAPCADVLEPDGAQRDLGHGEGGPDGETDGAFEEIPAGRHSPSRQRIDGDDRPIYRRSRFYRGCPRYAGATGGRTAVGRVRRTSYVHGAPRLEATANITILIFIYLFARWGHTWAPVAMKRRRHRLCRRFRAPVLVCLHWCQLVWRALPMSLDGSRGMASHHGRIPTRRNGLAGQQ